MAGRLAALLFNADATDLPVRQLRWLFAARAWIAGARTGRNPRAAVGRALGGTAAAGVFGLFMEQLILSWTDIFVAGSPDCLCIRPDEQILLDLLSSADEVDGTAFHALLKDMLPEATRERLYDLAIRVHGQSRSRHHA